MIPRALNAPLSWIGLMRVSEHERMVAERVSIAIHSDVVNAFRKDRMALISQRDDWRAKFKRAATDLAEQAQEINRLNDALLDIRGDRDAWQEEAATKAEEIERLNREVDRKISVIDNLYERIGKLRPDALLWRAARLKRRGNK